MKRSPPVTIQNRLGCLARPLAGRNLTRRELKPQATRQRVALGALEKDYILTLVLRHLYAEESWREILVFKGKAGCFAASVDPL